MTADVVPKPKWFRRAQSSGGLEVGKDVVKSRYGDPIDHSMNYDGSRGRYRVSQTGEIMSGNNLVKTDNWDAINHSGNYARGKNRDSQKSYGKLREEGDEQLKRLKKQRSKRTADSSRRIHRSRHIPESSGFNFIMKERDCLDTTFDGIESYGCKDTTGELFPAGAPPLSPIASRELQKTLDGRFVSCDANLSTEESDGTDVSAEKKDCLDTTFDGIERYGCKERTGEIIPASANTLSPKVSRELQQTLDGRFLSCGTSNEHEQTSNSSDNVPTGYCSDNTPGGGFGLMAGMIVERLLGRENQPLNKISDDPKANISSAAIESSCTTPNASIDSDDYDLEQNEELNPDTFALRINRENSILDVESSSNPEEEEEAQSRLAQLRQNKRAIERERLGLKNVQTIVIPRDSLYESEGDRVEDPGSDRPISELKVGSPVTKKQTEKFYCRRKFAVTATIFLISIGVVILAVALFWPTRIL